MELELELELKITELELNWKNGIDPNPAHCTHNAMFTNEMTILTLEFCERDVCPSNVRPRHIHNCHILSF